ncbi:uncharacterized protein MELLADRAFT_59310 [Melampsora larici-populina 98AG31]|uniref:Uncharacterized protein n=1 Tax=Melampsora larici-populina (strain 98AG31 / pathotype 3-4-7) TaxID=747676 RepID=F4R5U5_MELLP|nr:uncharacterized protein MELLADRAFT_59310 [Melampsora larici-populina 98AG31]EGG12192.1 hypothetical protein MELLADRAFT_59310 [Melampsora larici-populina 98AG31]
MINCYRISISLELFVQIADSAKQFKATSEIASILTLNAPEGLGKVSQTYLSFFIQKFQHPVFGVLQRPIRQPIRQPIHLVEEQRNEERCKILRPSSRLVREAKFQMPSWS